MFTMSEFKKDLDFILDKYSDIKIDKNQDLPSYEHYTISIKDKGLLIRHKRIVKL